MAPFPSAPSGTVPTDDQATAPAGAAPATAAVLATWPAAAFPVGTRAAVLDSNAGPLANWWLNASAIAR